MNKNKISNGIMKYHDPNDAHCNMVYALPSWIPCAHPGAYWLMETTKNGDCLFHSVHLCLKSIMDTDPYTSFELRHSVANTILDIKDTQALAVMETWKTLLAHAIEERDEEIVSEYKHAQSLLKDNPPFGVATRQVLYENMLKADTYWGDQYAVRVLEKLLNVRFMILKKTKATENPISEKRYSYSGQVGLEHGAGFNPKWHIVLVLDHFHYRPLVKRRLFQSRDAVGNPIGRPKEEFIAAFTRRSLPSFVKQAFNIQE